MGHVRKIYYCLTSSAFRKIPPRKRSLNMRICKKCGAQYGLFGGVWGTGLCLGCYNSPTKTQASSPPDQKMNNRNLQILVVLILAFLVGAVWWLLFKATGNRGSDVFQTTGSSSDPRLLSRETAERLLREAYAPHRERKLGSSKRSTLRRWVET